MSSDPASPISLTHCDAFIGKALPELELLQTLWSATPQSIIIMVPGTSEAAPVLIGDCNPVACHVHGYTRDELIGQSIDLIHATPWASTIELNYLEDLQGTLPYSGKSLHRRKDGSTFLLEFTVHYQRIAGIPCAIGFDRPIEGEDSANLAAYEIANRWLNAMESCNEAIWELELETRTLWTSPRWQNTLGLPSVEKYESLDLMVQKVHPEDKASVTQSIDNLMNQRGERLDLDFRYLNVRNDWIWVQMRGRVIHDSSQKPIRIAGSLSNISQRKRVERELRQAQQTAEAASRAKSQFLAVMSHEIRTPMNGVLGMATLLASTRLNAEQRNYLRTIETSGEDLLNVIDEVLNYSKLESGNISLEETSFDLVECLHAALHVVAPLIKDKPLELVFNIEPNLPAKVFGDPARLRQVLINLLGNAIKFTPNGYIELSARTVDTTHGNQAIQIDIVDTGIGIAQNSIEKLFEPFTQEDASTTRKYGGTGLGLAICKRLLELMNGTISIESEIGQGSRFRCELILDTDGINYAINENERLKEKRVLLIQVDSQSRTTLGKTLEYLGLNVTFHSPDQPVLELLESSTPFDAALLVSHPRSDQDTLLAHQIKTRFAKYRLPLIGAFSLSQSNSIDRQGAVYTERLTKPCAPAELERALAKAIFRESEATSDRQNIDADDAPVHTERVLIVEDNDVNRIVATQLLRKLGFQADSVESGYQALDSCLENEFDIIFMDVQMPGMNGFETLEMLRNRIPDTRPFPWVIALTADAMEGDRERCLEGGMDDYLPKPIRPQALDSALKRATEEIARRA